MMTAEVRLERARKSDRRRRQHLLLVGQKSALFIN